MVVAEKVKTVNTNIPQHVSQLIRTAELAYHGDAVTKRDLMLDRIDIKSPNKGISPISAASKRHTIFQGRPTSYLMSGDNDSSELHHKKGTFVHKMVNEAGDILNVSGVALTIPQGAVPKGMQITVGIMWEEKFLPRLTAKQALLSPLVICQPSVTFKKPVTLTLPHCAHKVKEDWSTTILKREGSEDSSNDWSPITDTDFSWKEITDTEVSVALHHFTGFTLVGESAEGRVAAKAVNMVAFSNPFHIGAMYKTKIYCVGHYHYKDKIQEVKLEEKSVNRRQSEGAVPLLVYQNGENVLASLDKYKNEEWELEGGREQFKQVIPVPMIPVHDDPVSEVHRQIVLMLDPTSDTSTDHGDWRSLAVNVGFTNEEIRWLESRQGQESPTTIVLERLGELGKTYQNLHTILIDIKRPDVASVLQTFVQENGNDVILQNEDRVRMRQHSVNTPV
ncbi:hypothetical protein FSP39_018799 [Pinctada imbricata]|uniref:ZU5 domain-containing protein n=1 Tax=Pinctada imbricata TaxID=66713 RepID=A0AA88Y642_PINIB|nr:hypothetical protein FSP39_018799 [Pinctada imbricata]